MNQKKLSLWLKAIMISVGICGLIVYLGILPNIGSYLKDSYPEFSAWHWPWMIFLWLTAVPCYAVLVLGWKIAVNIRNDHSFSTENAGLLQHIAWLIAGDILFFFLGHQADLLSCDLPVYAQKSGDFINGYMEFLQQISERVFMRASPRESEPPP